MKTFDSKRATEELIDWIANWFSLNGNDCNAVIGLSGGKDSTIIATLCARALGPERVIGVAMPDTYQGINDADKIAKYLGIKYMEVPIWGITGSYKRTVDANSPEYCKLIKWSEQAEQNIPPRIRMTTLYAIAQTFNGRVACCDNASEAFIGYSTLFGDNVGSFAPLKNLTVTEVRAIGHELGLPDKWVEKIPDDGLPHSMPDEEKFGFTYAQLDQYIRTQILEDEGALSKIVSLHNKNRFKTSIVNIPGYVYE